MSLPPLPTTTLGIIINWVQRKGQVLRHGEKVLQVVWGGGAKTGRGGNWPKKDARCAPGALILPLCCVLMVAGAIDIGNFGHTDVLSTFGGSKKRGGLFKKK